MLIKLAKFLGLAALTLTLLVSLLLILSAQASLDHNYGHSHATYELPRLTPTFGSGIARLEANGYVFRVRVAGFDGLERPTVVLLHGFPVTSAMWIDLLAPLEAAGYRVIAPDQRGYSPGARPASVAQYGRAQLISDVLSIANRIGADRFHLAGHDWGAAVGWSVLLSHPDRVASWSGLSIAHPHTFAAALENDPDQQARSAYFGFFRLPVIPETIFSANNFSTLDAGVFSTMGKVQQAEYRAVLGEPGALTAALNWYRAADLTDGGAQNPVVTTPTLFIWGNQDGAVGRAAIDAMEAYMQGPYESIELDAGHWLMEDETERVVGAIVKHINTVEATR